MVLPIGCTKPREGRGFQWRCLGSQYLVVGICSTVFVLSLFTAAVICQVAGMSARWEAAMKSVVSMWKRGAEDPRTKCN